MNIANRNIRLVAFCGMLLSLVVVGRADAQSTVDRQRVDLIQRRAEQLASEIEHLQEDIYIDVGGRQGQRLAQEAERALREVLHFKEALHRGVDREHLRRDFKEVDQQVHQLIGSLRAIDNPHLQNASSRVYYADEQLHLAVLGRTAQGPPRDIDVELIARVAHRLADESAALARFAEFASRFDGGRSGALQRSLEQFASEADHFHKAFEGGGAPDHVGRDFQELDRSWHQSVELLNQSPAAGFFLRRRAERVNSLHNSLHQMLQAQSDRPSVRYPFQR